MAISLFALETLPEKATLKKMEWFEDAKLGIFIHYGIYAVNGIAESWSFKNNQISYADYMKQLQGFTAKKYDAQQWAKLFKRKSGLAPASTRPV